MTRWGIVLVVVCAGCGDDAAHPDAFQLPDAGPPDAPAADAAPDAPSAACPNPATDAGGGGTYTLFLNFDGVTLTKGNCDNARTNCTSLISATTATAAPFLNGDPNRQAFIDQIVELVRAALLPYSVDIVTTRPASGDYDMVVIGGDCTLIGMPVGCPVSGTTLLSCNLTNRDHISLDFDLGTQGGPYLYANLILSDFGIFSNMSVTTNQGDCECRTCGQSGTQLCTYGRNSPTMPGGTCAGAFPTQDEQDLLKTAYGCR